MVELLVVANPFAQQMFHKSLNIEEKWKKKNKQDSMLH
jgi:hypothetical protein